MKKLSTIIIPLTLLLFFSGCAKDEPQGMTDAELVQAIIDAENKTEVSMEELPSSARGTMEDNYLNEYLHLFSMKASTLGYEVSIAGRAGNSGKRAEVYFDINGKKLDPDRDYRNEEGEYSVGDDGDAKADWKCFDIVYPISIQMPDGSILSIDGEEDTDLELVKEYYEENDTEEKPSMVFPITIITYEGVTKTINSEEDMSDAYRGCSRRDRERDWDNDRECFELVYPVTYVLPDGSTIEISDEEDEAGWESLKSWYDANPESDERPSLQYPVDIIFEFEESGESETYTLNNEEEMMEAKEECREMWGEEEWDDGEECYSLVYPISFEMPDGSIIDISGEDDEAGWMSIIEYYETNPSSEEEPSMQFPIDIVFETEEGEVTITMSSGEDLDNFEDERCDRPS